MRYDLPPHNVESPLIMHRFRLKTLFSLCLLPFVAGCALAPNAPSAPDALDTAIVRHLGPGFSGVVLVRSHSTARPQVRAYGLANIEKKLPVKADTPFQIASISKWMSSVAVLRLVDQGKLALDAPVNTYLPELPPHTGAITVRQLLSNSAGIPNGVMQEYKKDNAIANLQLSHLEASQRFATGKLLFAPGSGWEYSPTTWILVGALIERATGKPYARAMQDLVLMPAGLKSTAVPAKAFQDMPGAALAYKAAPSSELNMAPHIVFVAASGTLYSTAADLANIAHVVYDTPLLSAAARTELSRVVVPSENYALGGRVRKMQLGGHERSVAWQTGAVAGSKSLLAYVPGEGKTVVILNNTNMAQSTLATAAEAMLQTLY